MTDVKTSDYFKVQIVLLHTYIELLQTVLMLIVYM